MSTLAFAAIGFAAIIVVGSAAAWIYDLLEARFAGLRDERPVPRREPAPARRAVPPRRTTQVVVWTTAGAPRRA